MTVARSNSLRQHSPPTLRRPNHMHNDFPPPLIENDQSPTRPPPPLQYSPPYSQHPQYNTNSMPRDPYHPHGGYPPSHDGRGDPRNDYPNQGYRNGRDPREQGGTLDRRFPEGHYQPNGQYPPQGDNYRGPPPQDSRDYREYRDQRDYGRYPPPNQMGDRVDGGTLPRDQRPREREMRPQSSPQPPHLMHPGQQQGLPPQPRSPTGGHYPAYMPNGNPPTSPMSTLQRQQQGHPGGKSPVPPVVQHYERVCKNDLILIKLCLCGSIVTVSYCFPVHYTYIQPLWKINVF